MRRRFIRFVLTVATALTLAGDVAAQPSRSPVNFFVADAKLTATGVVYSKALFEARNEWFGERTIPYGLFIGGASPEAIWRPKAYQGPAPVRKEATPYEGLLGDFDTTGYVNQRLRARMPEARHLETRFTDDPALAEALVELAADKAGDDAAHRLAAEGRDAVVVVKISYGLGPRLGNEQLGFRKIYRPYVRLLCLVRRNDKGSSLVFAVIAWGAKGYKGGEANAKKIAREGLVEAFKTASEDAISLLIRMLNGESLSPMGDLVDESAADMAF